MTDSNSVDFRTKKINEISDMRRKAKSHTSFKRLDEYNYYKLSIYRILSSVKCFVFTLSLFINRRLVCSVDLARVSRKE